MFTTGRLAALASISLAAIAMPAFAADVTFERLLNAPNDPAIRTTHTGQSMVECVVLTGT